MAHGVTNQMRKIKRPPPISLPGPGPVHQVTGAPINIHKVASGSTQPRALRRARRLQERLQKWMSS